MNAKRDFDNEEYRDWWISTPSFTVRVTTNNILTIIDAAPILSKFNGQKIESLRMWLKQKFKNKFEIRELQ